MPIQLTVLSLEFDADEIPRNTVFTQDEITVGRDPINDLVLDCAAVASHHARIRIEENGHGPKLYITDLGSETGTILEDKKIQPNIEIPLPLNKRFTVGNFLVKPSELKEKDQKEKKKKKVTDEDLFQVYSRDQSEQQNTEGSLEELSLGVQEESQVSTQENSEQFGIDELHASGSVIELNGVEDHSDAAVADDFPQRQEAAKLDASQQELVAILVDGDDVGDLDFNAIELFVVNGRVTHKGQPLEGVEIDAGSLGKVTTDQYGVFSLADILDGTEENIRVSKTKFLFDTPDLKINVDGSDVNLEFQATELFTIAGKVVHKGVPMEGVEIDGGELGKTLTAADGSYSFKDVPDGAQYTLVARKGNFSFGTISARGK